MSGRPSHRPSGEPLETSLLFDVFVLNQALGRYLGEAMAASPLGPVDYAIYSAIFEAEQIGPTHLAGRLGMPLTTLMDHLARLESRGHARRFPNPRDGRASLVTLTASGLGAHRDANRTFELAAAAVAAALPGEAATSKQALADVRAALETARAARGSPRGGRREAVTIP